MDRRNVQAGLASGMAMSLGVIFVIAGVGKLRAPYELLENVYSYQLVGPSIGHAIALALPWLEIIVGSCLLTRTMYHGALLVSIGLGLLFTIVQAYALAKHLNIECGCSLGAAGRSFVSVTSLIRAIAVALAACVATCLVKISWVRNDRLRPAH